MRRSLAGVLGMDAGADALAALLAPRPDGEGADQATESLELSVVIPAYNPQPAMLRRALAGVAAQRPARPAQVIVVDDGSSEDLEGVVREFEAQLIRHPENRGLAAARNTGVEAASHSWVALLDSDDEWLPHHLATLWPLRDEHLLVGSSAIRSASDSSEDRVQGTLEPSPVILTSPASLLYPENFICPSAAMVNRDAVVAVGGFAPRNGVEDLHIWCQLLDRGTGIASPTVTVRYHIHERQMSRDFEGMHAAHLSVIEEFAGRSWWTPDLGERREGTAAWSRFREYWARGDRRTAVRALATVFGRPQRVRGVVGTWIHRLLRRRRSSRVQRDGGPSIVVLPGRSEAKARAVDALRPRAVSDWRELSLPAACVRLIRRPRGIALVDSLAQVLVARLAGVRPVHPEVLPELSAPPRGGTGAQSRPPLTRHSA